MSLLDQASATVSGLTSKLSNLTSAATTSTKTVPPTTATYHPLDPLTPTELAEVVSLIRAAVLPVDTSTARLWFKNVQLREPAKNVLADYLDEWHRAKADGTVLKPLPRQADVLVGVKDDNGCTWYEYYLTLTNPAATGAIERKLKVPKNHHVAADGEEMLLAEEALFAKPEFQAALARLALPKEATVVADAWIYGSDTSDEIPRYICYMIYLRFTSDPDSNHYASPLPLSATVLADDYSLVSIDYFPIFGGDDTRTLEDLTEPFPWSQYRSNEYEHGIRAERGEKDRVGLKPYRVIQPEGTSFSIDGRHVEWQKWSFHIGFNFREGLVISDVRYDGRKTFYRLSVSDMTVPYGDPRAPLHRKQAFDLGDFGAGLCANELHLGCDCLGEIQYLDFDNIDSRGKAAKLNSVVCIHEQDEGILWKHTNFRTGKPSVTRSRVLVVQTVLTVANYEYIFAWKFDQAAAVHLETRATGILSTVGIMPGETSPYGTIVSPGVLATNHQHLFSVRIDPSIDGHKNTVVQEDSVALPFDKANPPKNNLHGVGYTVKKTPLTVSGGYDASPQTNRIFKIINPSKINPISGRPIGYKLVPEPSQLMLAHPDSVAYQRAEFGDHHIYLTSHKDGELYSGGLYTNQSNGGANGIQSWIGREDNVEDADVVLWHTFGLTHNPRVEDFPVMPCEVHSISLKPVDFFTQSPANDVPASNQAFNRSKLANGVSGANGHGQGSAKVENAAKENGLGKSCCA